MQKRCARCQQVLNQTAFNWKYTDIKRSSYCRICSQKYIREHYTKNKKYYLRKAKRRNLAIKEESRLYISEYLKNHPCVDCGESDILVLEFDHRERSSKIDAVSNLIKQRLTLPKIIAEIAKCDVRCANCHRRKTVVEAKSWKSNLHQ